MGDSNIQEWELKSMIGSFFALVMIFAVLTGSGLVADEIGDVPTLTEDGEALIEIDSGDMPERPTDRGGDTGGFTWEFASDSWEYGKTIDIDGSEIDVYYREAQINEDEEIELRFEEDGEVQDIAAEGDVFNILWVSPTWGDQYVIVNGQEVHLDVEGTSDEGSIQIQINPDDTGWFSFGIAAGLVSGILWLVSVFAWGIGTLFELVIAVVTAIPTMLIWVAQFTWYIISGWLAIGDYIPGVLGLMFQGITLVLFALVFNGTAKIIKMIPTT